jgi:hypothetical protein
MDREIETRRRKLEIDRWNETQPKKRQMRETSQEETLNAEEMI